jgi:hypothetical protein
MNRWGLNYEPIRRRSRSVAHRGCIDCIGKRNCVCVLAGRLLSKRDSRCFSRARYAFNGRSLSCCGRMAHIRRHTRLVVGKAVFGGGRISYHRIIGAVFLYLLIALTFAADHDMRRGPWPVPTRIDYASTRIDLKWCSACWQ